MYRIYRNKLSFNLNYIRNVNLWFRINPLAALLILYWIFLLIYNDGTSVKEVVSMIVKELLIRYAGFNLTVKSFFNVCPLLF